MSYTYCSSAAIITRAGAKVNSTIALSDSVISQFCDNAEAFINSATRYDWTAASATITASYPHFKPILSDAISSLAAIDMITYDPSGYSSISESENIINVLYDRVGRCIEFLKVIKKPEVNI